MHDSGFVSVSRRTFLLAMSSVLALGLPEKAAASTSFEPFSFAFVSDVHLATGMQDGTYLLQESQLFLQDVVKQLNGRKLDFIVFGGDQVEGPGKDDAFWNLFIDVLQIANAPWFFVLGESDISGRRAVDKMDAYGPDLKGRALTSGKPYWSTDPVPNVHLIGLDTSRPNTTTGDISTEQLSWLKNDLEANRGKFTLAVSHHPLLAPPPYDGGPPWDDYMVLQGASAREVLAGSRDVRLCISGHVPINKVQQEGGIWYVSSPTLAMYPCQFKIFTVSPQAVHMETLSVSYEALVKKAKKTMETSRLAFQYSSSKPGTFLRMVEGEELDRNAVLPLVSGAVTQKAEKKKKEKPPKEEKSEKSEKSEKQEKPKRGRKREEATPEAKSDGKPETKPDSKPDSKSDAKPETKSETKADPKTETEDLIKKEDAVRKEETKVPVTKPSSAPSSPTPAPAPPAPASATPAPAPKPLPLPSPTIQTPTPAPLPKPTPPTK